MDGVYAGAQKKLDHILPIVKAHQLQASEDVIRLLLNCDLPFSDSGLPVASHTFSWAWLLRDTGCAYAATIAAVMDAHPSIRLHLAKAVDAQNHPALEAAHPSIRTLVYERALFLGRYEVLTEEQPLHLSARAVVLRAVDLDSEQSYRRVFQEISSPVPPAPSTGPQRDERVIDSAAALGAALQRLGGYLDVNKIDLSTIFSNCDNQGLVRIYCDEFVRYCQAFFGCPRLVAIKFMRDEQLCLKEAACRKACNLDGRYVLPLLAEVGATQREIQQEVADRLSHCSWLRGSAAACFLPLASRDLLSIFQHHSLDRDTISGIMREVAQALLHLHSRGICHGNVRMRNVVCSNGRHCLVDLTSAANLEIFYIQDAELIGAEVVTGYLPPEMFVSLSHSQELQVENYWKSCPAYETKWPRVRPFRLGGACYCARAFDVDSSGVPRDLHALPYRPALALAQLDMWAYGLMLFALASGQSLLPLSADDSLCSARDVHTAARWTSAQLQDRVDEVVADPLAADLIMQLLQPEVRDRPSSMKQILDHVYFSGVSNKRNSYVEQKIENIYSAHSRRKSARANLADSCPPSLSRRSPVPTRHSRLSHTSGRDDSSACGSLLCRRPSTPLLAAAETGEDVPRSLSSTQGLANHVRRVDCLLRRALFDSIEVRLPSCFVVVNQRLLCGDMSVQRDSLSTVPSIQSDDLPPSSPTSPDMAVRRRNAQRWFECIAQIFSAVSAGDAGVGLVDKAVRSIFGEEQLYLYLVDEVSLLPVVPPTADDVYPIAIEEPRAVIPRILPLMKLSLQAIAGSRDLGVFGRCFGFPPAAIPPDVSNLLEAELHSEVDSSLALPGLLQQAGLLREEGPRRRPGRASLSQKVSYKLFGDASEHASFPSHPLQALAELLARHDPKSTFAGIRRVQLPGGSVAWTAKSYVEKYVSMMAEEAEEVRLSVCLSIVYCRSHSRDVDWMCCMHRVAPWLPSLGACELGICLHRLMYVPPLIDMI